MTDDPGSIGDERLETEQQSERHASNLELFLDLVFVFAVTQIAGLFASDTGPVGLLGRCSWRGSSGGSNGTRCS